MMCRDHTEFNSVGRAGDRDGRVHEGVWRPLPPVTLWCHNGRVRRLVGNVMGRGRVEDGSDY